MRAEFESGSWVDLPDAGTLSARDKAVWSENTFMPYDMSRSGGVTQISLGHVARQLNAMLAHFISAWSYPWILPSQDMSVDEDTQVRVYEQSLMNLPIDDYNELEEAVEPLLEKLRGGPKGKAAVVTTTSSSSSSRAPRTAGRKGSRTTSSPSASSS